MLARLISPPWSAGAILIFALLPGVGAAAEPTAAQVQELIEQNRRLQEQVRVQQQTIDALNTRMTELQQSSARQERELRGLADRVDSAGPGVAPAVNRSNRDHEVRIAAEAGIAFFKTGRDGQFPKDEFRVDDPVITLEAPVFKDVYFFSELKLLTRETNVENFQLGELYVDFEDVSAAWGQKGLLSVRAGRINIPFGEEYLRRTPVTNPLISHSLSDIWGVDEGVEIYGRLGPAQYVLAVQNGGTSRLRDFNADKAIAGRVSWQPVRWLRVSGSAMRTGEIASIADNLTEVWFANGFFRAIGPVTRTGAFWANLKQVDAVATWKGGQASINLGRAHYDDSDPLVNNARNIRYGALELEQRLLGGLYGAVRYSEIRVGRGYPLAGWGQMGPFFFRPLFTDRLQRTSLGFGYRFGPPLVLKLEYTWETGHTTSGVTRNNEDFLGAEVGMKF